MKQLPKVAAPLIKIAIPVVAVAALIDTVVHPMRIASTSRRVVAQPAKVAAAASSPVTATQDPLFPFSQAPENVAAKSEGGRPVGTQLVQEGAASVDVWHLIQRYSHGRASGALKDRSAQPGIVGKVGLAGTCSGGHCTSNNNACMTSGQCSSSTPINHAPTLTATGTNPTFTVSGSAVSLYTGASSGLGGSDTGQSIKTLTLTVTNVSDGASEILIVDGSNVALTNGNSVTTTTNSYSVTVSVSGSTATVTITKTAGVSTTLANSLVNGLTYKNTSGSPTTSSARVVTLTSIKDTGGTSSGTDTATLSIASSVTIAAAAPTTTISTAAFSADTGSSSTDFTTKTAAQTISGTLSANLASGESVLVSIDNGSNYTAATTTVGQNTWSLSGVTLTSSSTLKVKVHNSSGDGTVYSQAYVLDTTAPSVSSIAPSGSPAATATSIIFAVTFSESVTGVDTGDFTLTPSGTAIGTIASISGSGSSYNVTVNTISGRGTLRLDLNSSGTGITDTAGNAISGGYTSGTAHTVYFNTAPALGGTFTTAGAVNDNATTTPFSGVTVSDADSDNVSIAITYTAANGTLSGTGLTGSAGSYTVTSAAPAAAQTFLQALVFTPTANQVAVGSTVQTTFTLTPNDGTASGSANATTVVTATSINDAPTDIALSANAISTFDSANSTIGTLSDTDADTGESPTYSIVSITDPSSQTVTNDGSTFNISSTALRATTPSGLSAGAYTVRVQVSDGHAGTFQKDLTVNASNSLIVTTNSDSGADATADGSYAIDAADGSGLSLREAFALASAGGKTVGFAAGIDGQTITLGSGATVAANTTLDASNASVTIGGGALTLSGALNVTVGSGKTVTINSGLSGAGLITKTGAGTLVLGATTNNTNQTGGVTVSAGTLSVANTTMMPQGTITLGAGTTLSTTQSGSTTLIFANSFVMSGDATVNIVAGSTELGGLISGSGSITQTGAGNFATSNTGNKAAWSGGLNLTSGAYFIQASNATLPSGTITLSGGTLNESFSNITVDNPIVVSSSSTVDVGTSITLTLTGTVSGSGAITKTSAGTLALSGTNTNSGSVTITGGVITSSGGATIGNSAALSVASGQTYTLNANETIGSLTGAGSVNLNGFTLTLGGDNTSTAFSGVISGTGGIVKTGTGTLTLSGNNTFTGSTTISAGGLTLNRSGGAIADTSAVTVSSGATLTLSQSDTVGSISGAGNIVLGSNTITVGGDDTSSTFSGVISGTGAIIKAGTGTFTLSGSNTYSGTTTVSAGTLSIGASSNVGSGGLTLGSGTTLAITGNASLNNAVSLTGNSTISVGASNTATLSGVVSGGFGISKAGAGTLILASAGDTYSGATTVSAGSLLVNGTIVSATTVSSGATLGGTGTIDAAVVVSSGGTLAPGVAGTNNGIGLLTVSGSLTLGGTLSVDLGGTATAGTSYDQVAVGDGVTLQGTASVSLNTVNGFTPSAGNAFLVLNNQGVGAISGTLSGLGEGITTTVNTLNVKASYLTGVNTNDLTLTIAAAVTQTPDTTPASSSSSFVVSIPNDVTQTRVSDPGTVIQGVPSGTRISDNGVVVLPTPAPNSAPTPVVVSPTTPSNAVIQLPSNTPTSFTVDGQTFTLTPAPGSGSTTSPPVQVQTKTVTVTDSNGQTRTVTGLQIVQGSATLTGPSGQVLSAFGAASSSGCGQSPGFIIPLSSDTAVSASATDTSWLLLGHLDTGSAIFHFNLCAAADKPSILAGGNAFSAASSGNDVVVFRGEQVFVDKAAQVARIVVRSESGKVGDAGDKLPVTGFDGFTFNPTTFVPNLTKDTGRLPAGSTLQSLLGAVPVTVGPNATALRNQDDLGALRYTRANVETVRALPVGEVYVLPGRPNSAIIGDTGQALVTVNETVMTFNALPRDPARLVSDLQALDNGASLRVVEDGSLRLTLRSGQLFALQPAWSANYDSSNLSTPAFINDPVSSTGVCHNADGWRQCYYPAVNNFVSLQTLVKKFDPNGSARADRTGLVTVTLQGKAYTILPDWLVINTPAAHANDDFWVDGNGRFYVRNTDGLSQGFVVR